MGYPPYWVWYAPYPYPRRVYAWAREYPQVQTDVLNQSLQNTYKLMEDGYKVLNKLSEHSFAVQVMRAAQAGNKEEVDRLMKSIGVSEAVQTDFSPSGIGITLGSGQLNTCCKVAMFLKWGGGG
ncbi:MULTISPECIES: hypothetical protein [Paenibacillus]|uniref:Uncharacterized protein n=1 Tax=Paenibacillus albilobatus TaxID=2716884 RepID=A0A919XEF6_9BACL|nr:MULTISPECIES: hypothetical protein [Paenibacillus]GIO30676.1 hypothetical protein J2TS6_18170 [Paenibacillus albilobatus]